MTLEDSRIYIFAALVALFALFEFLIPIYKDRKHLTFRWLSNFGLSFSSTAILIFAFPFLAVEFATIMKANNIGLFNWIGFDGGLAVIVTVLLLDMGIYWQHVLAHKWPLFWRLHRVHHSDAQMDVSTAVRFHPIEIIVSMGLKFAAIALIGAPALAVILFELILSSGALFNHSNIRISKKRDKWLQYIVVTPNMHRIHHSDKPHETDSNYGFSTSIWDRLFGSYTPNYDADRDIKIGLKQTAKQKTHDLLWCLKYPFKK